MLRQRVGLKGSRAAAPSLLRPVCRSSPVARLPHASTVWPSGILVSLLHAPRSKSPNNAVTPLQNPNPKPQPPRNPRPAAITGGDRASAAFRGGLGRYPVPRLRLPGRSAQEFGVSSRFSVGEHWGRHGRPSRSSAPNSSAGFVPTTRRPSALLYGSLLIVRSFSPLGNLWEEARLSRSSASNSFAGFIPRSRRMTSSNVCKERFDAAVSCLHAIGIETKTVSRVLMDLLKVYDNNWEHIEADDFRVLTDAIFDEPDPKVQMKHCNKRLKIKNEDTFALPLQGQDLPTFEAPLAVMRPLVQGSSHQRAYKGTAHDVNDIARGEEHKAQINISLARIGDESCCSGCFGDCLAKQLPCACATETGGEFAYTSDGLLTEVFLNSCVAMLQEPQQQKKFIKECWIKCGCARNCGNRIVQRGITRPLQVFLTPEGKGWGLRAAEEIPRGAFICEYAGEILTNNELYERNIQETAKARHTYPVYLNADRVTEDLLEDDTALCLDATFYGNVARFINHRCNDANIIEVPVEIETPDHHYYHIAFFTKRKIMRFEELTWDYGLDFGDVNHPIKAFKCLCQSKQCRDKKKFSRSNSRALVLRSMGTGQGISRKGDSR
uniref:Uncharacterized protein n=1 Tax=Avena sativa TaxID=4498 RepID=A0ACD5ZGM8_AVESA